MTFQEATDFLLQKLPIFQNIGGQAYKSGLERIQLLCNVLKNPEKKFKSIHIAGTNGKGSTSHFLASILQEAGYKVGLTTSPHLKSFTERIKINGKEIEQIALADFVSKYQNLIEQTQASFFEAMIALAFWYFAENQVDIAVVETGMGGRLDATNIILPEISVITTIGYDHQQWLGNTLAQIASEKAGIIKRQTPIVISEKHPETISVFIQKAQQENAPIYFAQENFILLESHLQMPFLELIYQNKRTEQILDLQSGLLGNYQKKNLVGVLKTIEILREKGYQVSEKALKDGIKNVISNTDLRGRWQILQENPLTIADIAHNEQGIREVVEQINQTPHQDLHLVLGFVSDKDVEKLLSIFPKKASFYFCQPNIQRAMPVEKISYFADKISLKYKVFNSVVDAYIFAQKQAQKDDLIFVGGSTFVVAEI